MAKKNKVLFIGWDAADWKIIDKLMANGLMPAMKRVVENGVRGQLATLESAIISDVVDINGNWGASVRSRCTWIC